MSRTPDVKHGKVFEKHVHEAFRKLHLTYPILWERVIDTHDAGNIISARDCDFKLVRDGRVMHIECKASTRYEHLHKSLVKPPQWGKFRLAARAGVKVKVWFHSVKTGWVEVWDWDAAQEANGKTLGFETGFHLLALPEMAEQLCKERV